MERRIPANAHVRPDSPRLDEWRKHFESHGATTDATPWSLEAMQERMRATRPALVFALLGTTRARARRSTSAVGRPETYEAVDYGLTSMLLHAVLAAGIRPRFVYLSSIGVREGSGNAYIQARWRMESELRTSGIPYTIARPSFVTGDDRDESRPGERVAARVANGLLGLAGALGATGVRERFRSMTGNELAAALVTAATEPSCENRVLDAAELRGLMRRPASAAARP